METQLISASPAAIRPLASTRAVLTVDDSRVLHTIVARYLEGTEFEPVGRAMDGSEAVDAVRTCAPDVILLDLIMPGVSGPDALAGILRWNPAARVVMSSSVETADAARDCLRAGAAAFLTKPFSRSDLLACLRRVCAPDGDR